MVGRPTKFKSGRLEQISPRVSKETKKFWTQLNVNKCNWLEKLIKNSPEFKIWKNKKETI